MSQGVAAFVWLFGLAAWFVIRLPHSRRARRQAVSSHRRSRRDRAALILAAAGLSVIPAAQVAFGVFSFADYPYQEWMGWTGSAFEAGFLALFAATHRRLGRNWSVTLELRPQHRLVTDGVYRLVRHPMYSSFFMWAFAQALLIPNLVAGLSGIAGVALLYLSRIGAEERMMTDRFGSEYADYAARTGRLFPRLFP